MGKSHYDPEKHHRQSIRLKGHDYSGSGAYMATICVRPRLPLFEHPVLRGILQETWRSLPKRFPGVGLDEFVIMPDHVHFILWLDANINKKKFGDIVGAYKSITTVKWLQHIKANNLNEPGKFWQDDYVEHVMRDTTELTKKRVYIRNNPLKNKL